MSVKKYTVNGKTMWSVDFWITDPHGRKRRIQKRKIASKELATAFENKARTASFEGQFFQTKKAKRTTVEQAWKAYEPITKRDNDSWQTDNGRAEHVLRHLGQYAIEDLSARHIDAYRTVRMQETTVRGTPPAVASLNREVGLLKRMITYLIRCGDLKASPIAHVPAMPERNVRSMVVDEPTFKKLYDAAEDALKPILVVAYDSGMRLNEILKLEWDRVDLKGKKIVLRHEDTKTEQARVIILTERVVRELKAIPRPIDGGFVFRSKRRSDKGGPVTDIRKAFARACKGAGLKQGLNGGVIFHDLRRSFVTRSRKLGIPESVIMRMTGHRTTEVFSRYNIVDEQDIRVAAKTIEQATAGW